MKAKSPFGSSTIRQLRQAGRITQIGELVLGVAGERSGIVVERARLADQIERDVGERQFLLEHRRMTGPFRQAVAQDQRIVRAAQQLRDERRLLDMIESWPWVRMLVATTLSRSCGGMRTGIEAMLRRMLE